MKQYHRRKKQPLEPWTPASDMTSVSVSEADRENGSPKPGDMLAHNPNNPEDRWLVAKAYFEENYILAEVPGEKMSKLTGRDLEGIAEVMKKTPN